ncbi:MAG: hypothetical protein JHD16_16830 [Solirubrobacteraceae bacterium]|nr:hypothetical protein [Solirubrobacteraceae bacterium]
MTTPPNQPPYDPGSEDPTTIGEPPTRVQPAVPRAPHEPAPGAYQPDPDLEPELEPHEDEKKTPWGWIAASAALAIVAIFFAIWALDLRGDLSEQRDATRAAQQAAEQAASDAENAAEQAGDAIDQSGALSDQLDSLTQSLQDATDAVGTATEEARAEAESRIDELRQRLEDLISSATEDAPADPTPAPTTP